MATTETISNPFHAILYDPSTQFWKQSDYHAKTYADFTSETPLKDPVYHYETESKVWRIVKDILSVLLVLPLIYRGLHALAGRFLITSSKHDFKKLTSNIRTQVAKVLPYQHMKVKRITVNVNGQPVDAAIMGSPKTLTNKRWILFSTGISGCYESTLVDRRIQLLCQFTNSNILAYNYPCSGANDGLPNRQACIDTHQAMFSILQDSQKGIDAEEIIDYSVSFGGGIQGQSLETLQLDERKYIFIKEYSFSSMFEAIKGHQMMNCCLRICGAVIAWLSGWNLSTLKSSLALKHPEIIIQRMDPERFNESGASTPVKALASDGTLAAESTHAHSLLTNQPEEGFKCSKFLIGSTVLHGDLMSSQVLLSLSSIINHLLAIPYIGPKTYPLDSQNLACRFLNDQPKTIPPIEPLPLV